MRKRRKNDRSTKNETLPDWSVNRRRFIFYTIFYVIGNCVERIGASTKKSETFFVSAPALAVRFFTL